MDSARIGWRWSVWTILALGASGLSLASCSEGLAADAPAAGSSSPGAGETGGADGGAPASGAIDGGGVAPGSGDEPDTGTVPAPDASPVGSGGSEGGSGTGAAVCTKSAKTYDGVSALGGSTPINLWICVPPGMEGKTATPAPLVIALHGYTQGVIDAQSPSQSWGFRPTSQWEVLAARYGFYVAYPDKGNAQYMSAFKWFAGMENSAMGVGRGDTEPKSIAQIVADVKAQYNIDPSKVFVNGLSAGAFMVPVLLATYPDIFAGGAMFEGGAYGCTSSCAAMGKKGRGWTWPGNHGATLVTNAWAGAPANLHPRLLAFEGDQDGAVTMENLVDVTQQWTGAYAIPATPSKTATLKGHAYSEYASGASVVLATIVMKGIGHGTPVDPGTGPDQGGWDPVPSQTMQDTQADQDWTNTAGIYGPYYAAKFWGIVP